jgi:anti-sigma regulatory factor (Ser/Thr protein kinase)
MDSWDYELAPVLAAIRPAATRFREWASARASQAAAADCELALVEACNNLITHNPNRDGAIFLHAEVSPFEVALTIRDTTDGFEWPAEPKLPPADAEQGRGIFLMHALMTHVEYERNGGSNELRLRRRL